MINTGKYHDATAISPRLSFEPIQFVKKTLKTVVIFVHNCEFVIATIIEISIGIVDGHIDHYYNQNYHDLHNCWKEFSDSRKSKLIPDIGKRFINIAKLLTGIISSISLERDVKITIFVGCRKHNMWCHQWPQNCHYENSRILRLSEINKFTEIGN